MDTQNLEKQAWNLYYKLSNLAYSQSLFELANPDLRTYKYRKLKLSIRAFDRWVRRSNRLFNYNPDGFAPSPALPSDVLVQGATYSQLLEDDYLIAVDASAAL